MASLQKRLQKNKASYSRLLAKQIAEILSKLVSFLDSCHHLHGVRAANTNMFFVAFSSILYSALEFLGVLSCNLARIDRYSRLPIVKLLGCASKMR